MDLPISVGARVRLMPEDKNAKVYRLEEQAGRFVVGLILEGTGEARTFVLTPEELSRRLQVLPGLAAAPPLPWDQVVAFVEALRMRLACAFDPHYAVSVTQVVVAEGERYAVVRRPLP